MRRARRKREGFFPGRAVHLGRRASPLHTTRASACESDRRRQANGHDKRTVSTISHGDTGDAGRDRRTRSFPREAHARRQQHASRPYQPRFREARTFHSTVLIQYKNTGEGMTANARKTRRETVRTALRRLEISPRAPPAGHPAPQTTRTECHVPFNREGMYALNNESYKSAFDQRRGVHVQSEASETIRWSM